MKRGTFFALMCAVTATHLAVIAAAVDGSTTQKSPPFEVPRLQVVSLVKPAETNAAILVQKVSPELVAAQPDRASAKVHASSQQVPNLPTQNVSEELAAPQNIKTALDPQPTPELIVQTTEGELALTEVLRERLPYITNLVTLEFLIDPDGITKQINCLDDSCSDAVVAGLSALLDLRFQPTADMQLTMEYRKIIEIAPALRF